MATVRLTKRRVEEVTPEGRDLYLFDSEVHGFGLRVRSSGVKSYFLQFRQGAGGRRANKVRYTIGRHGQPWTVEQARRHAKTLLAQAKTGTDPVIARNTERAAMTVAELCDLYLAKVPTLVLPQRGRPKKASTLAIDRGRIVRHIVPLLGNKRVRDLTSRDIERFQERVAAGETKADVKTGKHGRARVTGGRGTAARTVGLFGGILSFAVKERIRADNPVRGVTRYSDTKRERYLSGEELTRLGDALAAVETERPVPVAAIRFLALTGLRLSEALTLQWEHIDAELGCLRLPDSKTGARVVMLGAPALALLAVQPKLEGNPFVFPGERRGHHFVGLPKIWRKVRERAKLDGLRMHDLRHGFASVAAAGGNGVFIVGKLLGHADPKSTHRYVHLADSPVKAAADRTAETISARMQGKPSREIVVLRTERV
ncbi:MAG: DUF4102 domain-containing protein [Alphaproteobacteria bacterium]|nr:DUF4102 domain-containing protein [Alphaproteobacteria bacterium]